jgi:hypothetical protein
MFSGGKTLAIGARFAIFEPTSLAAGGISFTLSVITMLNIMVNKGFLEKRKDGRRQARFMIGSN